MLNKFYQKIYITIVMITLFVVLPYLWSFYQENTSTKDFQKIDKIKYAYLNENETKRQVRLPYVYKGYEPFELSVNVGKFSDKDYKSFAICAYYVDFEVYLDNSLIYKYETSEKNVPMSGGSLRYIISNLKNKLNPNSIMTVKFIPKIGKSVYNIISIDVGNKQNFIINLLKKDWAYLIVSGFLLIISLFSCIVGILNLKNSDIMKKIFNFGFTCFVISVFLLDNLEFVVYIFGEHIEFVYLFRYFAFLSFPYSFINNVDTQKDVKLAQISNIIKNIVFINFTIQTIFTFTGISEYKHLNMWTYIILYSSIVYSDIYNMKYKYKSLSKTKRAFLFLRTLYFLVAITFFIIIKDRDTRLLIFVLNVIGFMVWQIFKITNFYLSMEEENSKSDMYQKMMRFDTLTSLKNRYAFNEKIEYLKENRQLTSIVFVDLNDFKLINDNLGHLEGDNILIKTAQFLKNYIKSDDVYRIGGDEFVLIVPYRLDYKIAKKLNGTKIYAKEKGSMSVSLAVGMCIYDDDIYDIYDVIRIADMQMYDNKRKLKEKNKI